MIGLENVRFDCVIQGESEETIEKRRKKKTKKQRPRGE